MSISYLFILFERVLGKMEVTFKIRNIRDIIFKNICVCFCSQTLLFQNGNGNGVTTCTYNCLILTIAFGGNNAGVTFYRGIYREKIFKNMFLKIKFVKSC